MFFEQRPPKESDHEATLYRPLATRPTGTVRSNCPTSRRERSRLRRARIDRVEQQLVGAVRLATEGSFDAQQVYLALTHRRLGRGYRVLQIALPPSPPAPQRSRTRIPDHWLDTFDLRFGRQPERRAVLEEHIRDVRHPIRDRIGVRSEEHTSELQSRPHL